MYDQMRLQQKFKYKNIFTYLKNDKNGSEDFQKLNFETESGQLFEEIYF